MRRLAALTSLVLFVSLASCQGPDATNGSIPDEEELAAGSSLPDPIDSPSYSGEWIERDGTRICDGYLARREDQDFCVVEIPDDWIPFEFGGNTYYSQPLTE